MQEDLKWNYLRTYFGGPYSMVEVDRMFYQLLDDRKKGDRYAITFSEDMKAQVHLDMLKINWFELSSDDIWNMLCDHFSEKEKCSTAKRGDENVLSDFMESECWKKVQPEDTVFLEPRECFDSCIVGVTWRPGSLIPIINYDYGSCMFALMDRLGIERQEAVAELGRQWTRIADNPGKPNLILLVGADGLEMFLKEWDREVI